MFDLPPYTYIPGRTPHPFSDPDGHSNGISHEPVTDIAAAFAHGLKLFNHGYYWEAHEAWEGVWIALGRSGTQADFIKGLIKLAACGVKCLEGNETGARRHLQRATELFRSVQATHGHVETFGVCLDDLLSLTSQLATNMPIQGWDANESNVVVKSLLPQVQSN